MNPFPDAMSANEFFRKGVPPLYVMIAYDDPAAYRRALRMLVTRFDSQENPTDIRLLPWQFEEPLFRQWRQHALADATRAEMFVVSTSSDVMLPASVAEWLAECFTRRRDAATTVIALDQPEHPMAAESLFRQGVRRAAEAAGLEFTDTAEPLLAAVS